MTAPTQNLSRGKGKIMITYGFASSNEIIELQPIKQENWTMESNHIWCGRGMEKEAC